MINNKKEINNGILTPRKSKNVGETTHQDLIQKVLNKLLVQGSRCQETVEISSEQLCHKVTIHRGEYTLGDAALFECCCSEQNVGIRASKLAPTYMSSNGEMKMSLRLIIYRGRKGVKVESKCAL